jgi:required for meiotic nuclear division protein 1
LVLIHNKTNDLRPMKISAFYIAELLNLKKLKETYAGTLLQGNATELFYRVDEDHYFYAFDYGAVVFAGMGDTDISQNLALLQPYCEHPLKEKIRDDFEIQHKPNEQLTFGFDALVAPMMSEDVLKIAMLNTAHSVALDFYSERAHTLLSDIRELTNEMEISGTIRISRKNMLRFIGRSLNSKNRIVENLFIFDSPDQTWEDEYLDKIHRGLGRTFELQTRFKEIEYTFKVVEDNLSVFREWYMHRESSQLEWIIIALICIEVFDLIIRSIF